MLPPTIIGRSRSGPGRFSMRRRIRRLRRRSASRTLGFTRKPPLTGIVRTCSSLYYSRITGGFRALSAGIAARKPQITLGSGLGLVDVEFRLEADEPEGQMDHPQE